MDDIALNNFLYYLTQKFSLVIMVRHIIQKTKYKILVILELAFQLTAYQNFYYSCPCEIKFFVSYLKKKF